MKRIRDALKTFDKTVNRSKAEKYKEPPEFDFKGQKIHDRQRGQGPQMTNEQFFQSTRFEQDLVMQPRGIRLKNWGLLGMFMAWYAGVMCFIAYRLKSDDLEQMENEA